MQLMCEPFEHLRRHNVSDGRLETSGVPQVEICRNLQSIALQSDELVRSGLEIPQSRLAIDIVQIWTIHRKH